MPRLFGKKNKSSENIADAPQNAGEQPRPNDAETNGGSNVNKQSPPEQPSPQSQPPRPKLVFHCQQAHGSPTGIISGFTNVKELYQKIADCYDIEVQEVSANILILCRTRDQSMSMRLNKGRSLALDSN